jgi:hypothetical protein
MMKKMVNNVIFDFTDADVQQNEIDTNYYNQNVLPDEIRAERDRLLAETDYLALSDNTMSAAMTTYRQALRDITDQAGFPTSVTWPTKP